MSDVFLFWFAGIRTISNKGKQCLSKKRKRGNCGSVSVKQVQSTSVSVFVRGAADIVVAYFDACGERASSNTWLSESEEIEPASQKHRIPLHLWSIDLEMDTVSFGNNKTISFVFLVEFWTQLLIFIGFKKIRRQKDYTKKSFSINGSYTWERVNLFVYVFCFLFLCKFSHRLLFRGVSFQFLIGFCVCVCVWWCSCECVCEVYHFVTINSY